MVVLRGRVFQVGAAVSVALLGLLAVTLGWAAIQYRQFSADISQSRNRLPASVGRALPAAPPGALDAPEVTLVRYTAGLSTGGAVLFFTDPKRLMSFLALPPSTHIGSRSLARLDVPTTIAALRASTAVRVDHVALIDRSDVGSLVSGLGGITIANPDVVRETDAAAGGSDTRRPAGAETGSTSWRPSVAAPSRGVTLQGVADAAFLTTPRRSLRS